MLLLQLHVCIELCNCKNERQFSSSKVESIVVNPPPIYAATKRSIVAAIQSKSENVDVNMFSFLFVILVLFVSFLFVSWGFGPLFFCLLDFLFSFFFVFCLLLLCCCCCCCFVCAYVCLSVCQSACVFFLRGVCVVCRCFVCFLVSSKHARCSDKLMSRNSKIEAATGIDKRSPLCWR